METDEDEFWQNLRLGMILFFLGTLMAVVYLRKCPPLYHQDDAPLIFPMA